MRILMITGAADGYGGYLRCFNLAKQLVRRGHQVFLVCPGGSKFGMKFDFREGVQVLTTFSTVGLKKVLPGTLASTISASIAQIVSKADIVHVFSVISPISSLPALTAKLARAFHLRDHNLVVDWDDLWGRGGILKDFNLFIRSIETLFEEGIPRLGEAVTTASEMLFQRALNLGVKPQFALKLPNGADIESITPLPSSMSRARLGLPQEMPIVGHLGYANLNALLDEITALNKRQDVLFVVVGNFPRYGKIATGIRGHPNVLFTGRQPRHLVPHYLAASDVLLLDQEPVPSSEARWPIRFGDYLAAGRPIVTPRIGDISRIIEYSDCGLLSKPGDPRDLAEKLLSICFDRDLRERLGRNARRVAETELSWEVLAERLDRFYRRLLDGADQAKPNQFVLRGLF